MRAAAMTVLDQIMARKRAELLLEQAQTPLDEIEALPRPERRPFREALEMARPAIISEIKKASPSAGVIAGEFDPAAIAAGYEAGGAAALSVLTDPQFFQGSLADLEAARAATSLPVLRKDFSFDRYHLIQAAAAGADAILLIVAALTDYELVDLMREANDLELDALVEVHNETELDRALAAGADLIGANNRNLKTLEVSLGTSFELAKKIPSDVLSVSESGIRSADDILRLMGVGFRGFLIGESLMKRAAPGSALAGLIQGVRKGAA